MCCCTKGRVMLHGGAGELLVQDAQEGVLIADEAGRSS